MEHIYAQQTENHEKRQAIACRRVSAGRGSVETTEATPTPYQGRVNALLSYNFFRRLAAVVALVVMVVASLVVNAQSSITVYDGTNTNSYLPAYGLYADTRGCTSEYIIPSTATDMSTMTNGTITKLTFYPAASASATWTATFKVYMAEVDYNTLSNVVGPDACTVVYTGTLDATGGTMVINLDNPYIYEGGNLLIGTFVETAGNYKSASFYGTNVTGAGYNHYSSSNSSQDFIPKTTFEYTPGVAPTCPRPTGLTVSNITSNSATIRWTAGGSEDHWDIYHSTSNTAPNGSTTPSVSNTSSNPCTITGITSPNTYYVWVRGRCSDEQSNWAGPLRISTVYCTPNATSVDGSGITNVQIGTSPVQVNNSNYPTSAPYYGDYTSMVGEFEPGATVDISITYTTGTYTIYSYGTIIWVDWNKDYVFSDDEIVYTGMSAQNYNGTPEVLSPSFPIPAAQAAGDYRMRIAGADSYFDGFYNSGSPNYSATHDPCFSSSYAVCHDYTLRVTSSCPTTISTLQDWNDFCDCVNDGHDYSGETVYLADDVSGVTQMAGTESTPFRGTFDGIYNGQPHTLTVGISGTGQYLAPFRHIDGATIQNLTITGTVTNNASSDGPGRHTGGLVGATYGTNTIRNCHVTVNVQSTEIVAGLIGHALSANNTIEGCVYGGTITLVPTTYSYKYAGGFVAWSNASTITINNCFFNGSFSGDAGTQFHPVGCKTRLYNDSPVHMTVSLSNCYYTTDPTSGFDADYDFTVNNSYNTVSGTHKHAYTVTGDGCVTVDLEPPATTYNVSGIVAYSPGIKYVGANGTIYGGNGDNMHLILGCSNGGVESYSADHGTLSGSELDGANDPYTLTMTANNTVISAVESSCPITEITSVTDWNKFCTCVSTGSDYNGLTVHLRANISVTTMAGDGSHLFRGTFDGHEHTITVTYTATDDGGTAPFRAIDGATFQDLHITGTISMGDHSFGAGLAAKCYGNVTITNCKSSVTISSTHSGDGTNGGFISVNYGQYPNGSNKTVTFNGCVFSGRLLGSNTNRNGGFVGYTKYETDGSGAHWAMVVLNNCLFAPTEVTMSNVNSATFSRYNTANHSNRVTTNNSYYTQPFTTAAFAANETDGTGPQGKQAYTVRGIEGVTAVRTGEHTDYSVSGISAYTPGLVYNNTIYGGNGDNLSLSLSYGGVAHDGYVADHGTLSGTETDGTNDPYSLTMIADSTKIKVACPNSITNRAKWNAFCNCVNNGHDYYNETVTLDANLTGGQTVSTMAGLSESGKPFKGTFEGNENTINVNINNSTGSPTNDDAKKGAAPFRYIDGATIRNLTVTGSVTSSAHHAAGLVGYCKDGGTNTIRNCHVSTNVTNNNAYDGDDGHNYVGGIIGHNLSATTSIIGCVYDGTITSQGFKGGMVGFGNYNSNVTITDSYFNGAYSTNGYANPNFSPIACHGSGRNFNFTFSNFYYNTDAGTFTAPTYEGTVNANYSGTGRAKHAYSVTGDGCVTVNLTPPSTTYNVSGIVAYSPGIRYVGANGTIYGGNGDNMNLLLGCNSGTVDNYEADYGALSGSATSGSNDPYTLTMVNHNTIIYTNVCKISYVLNDSYGDGWNGNAIKVIDLATGNEIASWTIPSGSGPEQGSIIVPNGSEIQFVWVSGSYSYECSYSVSDRVGIIFEGTDAMSDSPLNHKACSICRTPTNLTISAITNNSATVRWTENGSATSWTIEYSTSSDFSGAHSVTVSDNPYTLTGLAMGTTYYVRVRANCGGSNGNSAWSDPLRLQTDDDCATVGTGTSTSYYTPIYSYSTSYYSYSQQLYTAAQLEAAGACRGAVNSIKFRYMTENNLTVPIQVYIGSTSSNNLSSAWISDADLTLVYTSPAGGTTFSYGWVELPLSTPFYWDGESNILVAVHTTGTPSMISSGYFEYTSFSSPYLARYTSNSSSAIDIDANNVATPTGSPSSYRPNIKFCIDCCTERTGTAGFDFCRDALTIDVGSSAAITMPVEGADGVSPSGAVSYSSSNTSVATVSSDGTVTGVANGSATITATMAYDDPTGYCPVSAKYNVQVGPPAPCFEIGTGTSNIYYPIPGFYGWQYDVYIYTPTAAPELNDNLSITSIAYYITSTDATSTSQMTVWVKDVDPATALATGTTFATYINGASQVYNNTSYSAPNTGWQTLDFSSSFTHTGGQALLVAVRGVGCSTSGGCSRYCRYTSATGTHWYRHKDSGDPGTTTTTDVYKDDQRANIKLCYEATAFTPDVMPTVEVTNATQESICIDDPVTDMVVTASNDVTFAPALNTLGLSYNTSTHTISGTPNFTDTRTVTVTTTSSDGCLKAEKELRLIVVQCCTPRDGTLEFCKDEVNVTTGTSDFSIPLTNTVSPAGTVTYSCDPAGVVTVNATTGLVHPVATGTATVTATIPAETISGTDYCSKSASYTVTVGTPGTSEECDEIGNGTTDAQAPTQNAYKHCWSQMIYTHDEISHCGCGSIKKIIFNAKTTDPRPRTTKIYMGTIDASYFENTTSFIPANNMTLVWESSTSAVEGDVNNNGKWDIHAGENVFTLPTAFNYSNCNKNLVIAFYSFADNASYYNFYGTETTDTTVIFAEGDGEHGSTSDPRNYYESNSNLTGAGFAGLIKRTDKRPDVKICFNCDFTPTIFPSATLNPITQTVCKTGDVANAITDIVVTAVVPDGGSVTLTPSDKGLSYDSGTGKITGTPNFTGSQEFTLTVKDAESCLKDEKTFTVTVNSLNATIEFGN